MNECPKCGGDTSYAGEHRCPPPAVLRARQRQAKKREKAPTGAKLEEARLESKRSGVGGLKRSLVRRARRARATYGEVVDVPEDA